MQEEDALSNTPQRSRSKLVRTRATLRDAVTKAFPHVVNQNVGPEIHGLV
jgi:hypothetical protein